MTNILRQGQKIYHRDRQKPGTAAKGPARYLRTAESDYRCHSPSNSQNLKSIGLKATLPRLKILDLFQHADERHPDRRGRIPIADQ